MVLERTAGPALQLCIYGYHQKSFIGYIFCIPLSGGSSWLSQYFCSFAFSNRFYTCTYIHKYVLHRGDFGKNSSKYGEIVGVSHLTQGGNMEFQLWVRGQRGWSGSDPSICYCILLPSSKRELQSACLAQRLPAKAAFSSGSPPRCDASSI